MLSSRVPLPRDTSCVPSVEAGVGVTFDGAGTLGAAGVFPLSSALKPRPRGDFAMSAACLMRAEMSKSKQGM